ncbi:MAG: hypothetical protein AAFX65_13980 [Cyanobacteria bacterium J06638_7]
MAEEAAEPEAEVQPDAALAVTSEQKYGDQGVEPPDTSSPASPTEEPVDIAFMTKAEIIERCSRHYYVLLDSGLNKSTLVSEAEALAAAQLPDARMDDLMT